MNLNADVGEGSLDDEAVLRCIDSASICCGAHAGSRATALATVRRCLELGVEIGAHPGYGDPARFGRVEIGLSVAEIERLLDAQLAVLHEAAPIAYVKPHGALYHRASSDRAVAEVIARSAAKHGAGVVGARGSELLPAAVRAGVRAFCEGFADRRMLPDGGLAPRDQPDALLDPAAAAVQAVSLARSGDFDTICIHGDTPDAGEVARAVRRALDAAGVETSALRPR